MSKERYRCPCCGYYTLGSRGDYGYCGVCLWQDDDRFQVFGQDDAGMDGSSWGPNRVSLSEGRRSFLECGASRDSRRDRARKPLSHELPENNTHQPCYRPAETIAPDLDLKLPLEPPRLTHDEAIEIARADYFEREGFTFKVTYGSTVYPRYRRLDDGAILEPEGTRDFWLVRIDDGMRTVYRHGPTGVKTVTLPARHVVLVDDKEGCTWMSYTEGECAD